MRQQSGIPARPPAPADMAVGPHQETRRLRAVGRSERALPIMQYGDARLVRDAAFAKDGNNAQRQTRLPRPGHKIGNVPLPDIGKQNVLRAA
jgi:hypothetical protein